MKTKILILSQNAWRDDNSFGSSYSNIFKHVKNVKIANIYCESALPRNDVADKYFQMDEKSIIKNLKNKNIKIGKEVFKAEKAETKLKGSNKVVLRARKLRWQFFFWGRDLIWKVGRWKSEELKKFIDDFDADVLFFPLYVSNHMNDLAYYIIKYTKKRLIFYVSDDVYMLKQLSLSPLYWINRFIARGKIKRVMKHCDLLYVISDIQKQDYEKIFGIKCKVLTKGDKFVGEAPVKSEIGDPIKLVYTGNIGSGRWKTLSKIAAGLKKINRDGLKAVIEIYTFTPTTKKMELDLNIGGTSLLKKGVSAEEVKKIHKNADILVHVESLSLKETLKARQSLSTKVVDYFASAKCIFAVGDKRIASIDHLISNDAAIVATSEKQIYSKLKSIIDDKNTIIEFSKKAWECGKSHHQIDKFTKMIKEDIDSLIKK